MIKFWPIYFLMINKIGLAEQSCWLRNPILEFDYSIF